MTSIWEDGVAFWSSLSWPLFSCLSYLTQHRLTAFSPCPLCGECWACLPPLGREQLSFLLCPEFIGPPAVRGPAWCSWVCAGRWWLVPFTRGGEPDMLTLSQGHMACRLSSRQAGAPGVRRVINIFSLSRSSLWGSIQVKECIKDIIYIL